MAPVNQSNAPVYSAKLVRIKKNISVDISLSIEQTFQNARGQAPASPVEEQVVYSGHNWSAVKTVLGKFGA